uniref:Uncharacterized protein n=1 Tax=Avena sativa TaxID=4498 RepID=A0ACD5VBN8_AVESA
MATEATISQGQTELEHPSAASNGATPLPVGTMTAKQGTTKKTLADDVASARRDDSAVQRPGHIGPIQNWRLLSIYREIMSSDHKIHLGLVSSRYDRRESRPLKLSHLQSLSNRGVDGHDAADFTRSALRRFRSRETEIRLQHSPEVMKQHDKTTNDYGMLEELLLDTAFILEQLLRHWEAGTQPTSTPAVARPKQYRFDLVQHSNQTPYILLQELVDMVKVPRLAASKQQSGSSSSLAEYFLRSIAIGYIVAEPATEWLLTNYMGPVYHLLHLVYLHLASTVEHSPQLPPGRSLWARCKAMGRRYLWTRCDCEAMGQRACSAAARSAKKALRRSPDNNSTAAEHVLFATAWWSYSMIPPARDLCRAGIRLRPKKGTRCLAAVYFRDGVLELPTVELNGFDCRLLINLVALELEWQSSRPLFLSYAVFMGELMTTQSDMDLLQSAMVLTSVPDHNMDFSSPQWIFFGVLADLNSGRELHDHFVELARKVKSSYDHLNKSRAAACAMSSCLSR